jgi:hypothetical protein
MLSPGIMISACGLLLLGMNNKYSLVVNRIRLLNDERRRLRIADDEKGKKKYHKSIGLQIRKLQYRVILVRNAVFSYSVAVAFFIISCMLIGLNHFRQNTGTGWAALIIFLTGMIFVLAGIVFAAIETWKGYKIVEIEIKDIT